MALDEEDLTKIKDMIEPLKEKITILNQSNANLKIRMAALKKLISQDFENQIKDIEEHHKEQIVKLLNEIDERIEFFKNEGFDHEGISSWGICIATLIMSKIAELDETNKIDPKMVWGENFVQKISNDIDSFTEDEERKKYIESKVQELMAKAERHENK